MGEFTEWGETACYYLISKLENKEELTEYEKFMAWLVCQIEW